MAYVRKTTHDRVVSGARVQIVNIKPWIIGWGCVKVVLNPNNHTAPYLIWFPDHTCDQDGKPTGTCAGEGDYWLWVSLKAIVTVGEVIAECPPRKRKLPDSRPITYLSSVRNRSSF
jgi:hypothetical protein